MAVLALSVARWLQFGSASFVVHLVGNVHIMERAQLLAAMLDAKTPNESSTAIYGARLWLADHPDDQTVWSAMADLIEVERQSMSHA